MNQILGERLLFVQERINAIISTRKKITVRQLIAIEVGVNIHEKKMDYFLNINTL